MTDLVLLGLLMCICYVIMLLSTSGFWGVYKSGMLADCVLCVGEKKRGYDGVADPSRTAVCPPLGWLTSRKATIILLDLGRIMMHNVLF